MGARGGRAKDDEARGGDIVLAEHFDRIWERGDHGGDPSFALGLLDKEPKLGKRLDPNGPKCEKIRRLHDKNDIVYVRKKLYNLCRVSVLNVAFDLLEKVVNGNTKMRAENSRGETLPLKNTLCDLELSEGGM